jgi:ubiquinone/menaquinone biosynthesis C-methylase UbiE
MRDAIPLADGESPAAARTGEFSSARLLRLSELEGWHFWFVARRDLLATLLRSANPQGFSRVLDVGCGTGANVSVLRSHARRVVGLDFRPEGILQARQQQSAGALFVQGLATGLPFAAGTFDVVTVLDVLEHVDDEEALAEIRRVLRPGGAIVISVPAMPWLWSFRDVDAGHVRRYERRGLMALLDRSRLELQRLNYYQCLLFPLVVARVFRRRSAAARDREESPAPLLNSVLTWINRAEVLLGRFVSWPFGSSLVAVCRKPMHEQHI